MYIFKSFKSTNEEFLDQDCTGNETTVSFSLDSLALALLSNTKLCWLLLSGPVPYDNQLSTKEARNEWELEMSNAIIIPQLKVEIVLVFVLKEN